ncbi:hypothetical protein [Bradyrhizobium diazoefficiens]|nr:hypothetical protein [Bradyrhizobium diazoefficiens]
MHPQLSPKFPIRLGIAAAALWCALMAGAVSMRLAGISAPVPARAALASPKIAIVRAIPMIPELVFDDRWQAPAPAMQHARMAEDLQIKPDQPKAAQKPPRRVERHADRVCGSKGRRYFRIGRHLSWRCRR